MYTLHNFKPSFGTSVDKGEDIENTIPLGTVKDPDVTLATVLMTRLHDPRVQTRFHRLMLVDPDGRVLSTYPLNRKINHVGRSRRSHIIVKDSLVSIRHLSISVSGDTCMACDLDSSNGTFINGERLEGGRELRDGDEIMIGKTMLRFAVRQTSAPARSGRLSRKPVRKQKLYLSATAVFGLVIAAAIVFKSTPLASGLFADNASATAEQAQASSPSASAQRAQRSEIPAGAGGTADLSRFRPQSMPSSYIQQALADYAAGQIDSATQTLNMISTAREQTSEAFQARQIIALFSAVRQLHDQALQARKQKKYAEAIDYWDRLLTVDMELVGDRPSFFAAQAEQQVKTLTYDYALEAFHSKNHEKARQLCRAILQMDPKDRKALALLAKIDPQA